VSLEFPAREIERIDAAIDHALESGDTSGLDIIGYGEVSCVVAYQTEGGRFAVKRLPPFQSEDRLRQYEVTLKKYLERLASKGITVAQSELQSIPKERGQFIAYCIQPMLDESSLGPKHFSATDIGAAKTSFSALIDRILSAVDDRMGLDAQISNWSIAGGKLRYIDVTTPLMRDAEGKEELDVDLFLASLPAPLRPVVKRFMIKSILDKYYDRRGVVLDLLGNLIKERLEHLIEPFLAIANERLETPITSKQIRAYYADDASTWALLQKLRAADRFIQRRVLRRRYPFLLPGKIER